MTQDAWPSPDSPAGQLPRIEDLPVAEQGYDPESVRAAFDSFYRHAAQLDASLRALEAVEVFRRDADALRNDLRALRALGIGGGFSEPSWTAARYDVPSREVPAAVFRLAAEAALIVAVAVIAGVAHFRPALVVALMAGAFVIVAISEWLAGRGRFVPPSTAFLPPPVGEPAPYVEAPAPAWGAVPEPDEDTEPEALAVIAAREALDDAAAVAVDPWEAGPDGTTAEEEPDQEPVLAERVGFFRRRRR